jgi:hypothetical protein
MKQSRLFTFGCSFTQYCWPTWADILGREFEYYENWGMCAAGNQLIFNSLTECHLKNTLQKDDTVIIMWTNAARIDRYMSRTWYPTGNVLHEFNQLNSDQSMYDLRGFLIRDLAVMHGAAVLLDSIGCNYQFHTMVPVELIDQRNIVSHNDDVSDVLDLYSSIINKIKPSVFTTMYNNDWSSLSGVDINYVSTYKYREELCKLQEYYYTIKGADWPSFDNIINNKLSNVSANIVNDIKKHNLIDRYNNIIKEHKKESKFISSIRSKLGKKHILDEHPLPNTHLKYIQSAMLEYKISNKTIEWVNLHNDAVLNDEIIIFDRHQPNRL